MFILFLKRLLILGVFFAFFFFACESTEHNPTNRGTTTEDDDNTGRNRSRPRSSSRGSSGDGNTDGSSTGEPDGPTVSGGCPSAEEVTRYSPLTTITFEKKITKGSCLGGRYRHPLYNDGEDDSGRADSCDYRCAPSSKGSASPNQNVILFIDGYDPDTDGYSSTQNINLNESVVGNLRESSDTFYIYFKIQGEDTKKSELEKTILRWPTCVCSGQSEATKVTHARIRSENKIYNTDICQNNVVKFWLAKYDGDDCRFY